MRPAGRPCRASLRRSPKLELRFGAVDAARVLNLDAVQFGALTLVAFGGIILLASTASTPSGASRMTYSAGPSSAGIVSGIVIVSGMSPASLKKWFGRVATSRSVGPRSSAFAGSLLELVDASSRGQARRRVMGHGSVVKEVGAGGTTWLGPRSPRSPRSVLAAGSRACSRSSAA